MKLFIPIRTPNPVNGSHSHWATVARLRKQQRQAVDLMWRLARTKAPTLPAVVTLTRQGPTGGLDDDNLRPSLKAIRDAVAAQLGVDDGDPIVRWEYQQERAAEWGVLVEIRPA